MIPDEAVEAAAKVYNHVSTGADDWDDNDRWTPEDREIRHGEMRAALEAAAPHLMAAAWERGYLFSYYQERGWTDDGTAEVPEHLAEDIREWNPHNA